MPLGPPVETPEDLQGTLAPAAVVCEVDGRDARSCPACNRVFLMKPEFTGKTIRCRGCKSVFSIRVVEFATSTVPRQDDSASQAPEVEPQPTQDVTSDLGDLLGDIREAEPVPSVVRPINLPRRPASASAGTAQVIAVVAGGACALPITQLILWWVFAKDPLKIAAQLPDMLRWLAPTTLTP